MMMMMMMIYLCRVKHNHHQLTNMPPSIGGPEVDNVVIAAFAALVWHTPTLRQQISRYGNLCVFTCIIFIFVFHCTHVRMSYVLNSYLLTYLLTVLPAVLWHMILCLLSVYRCLRDWVELLDRTGWVMFAVCLQWVQTVRWRCLRSYNVHISLLRVCVLLLCVQFALYFVVLTNLLIEI